MIRLTSQTGMEQITQFLTFSPLMWVFSEQTRDVRASSSDQYSGDCRSVSRTVVDVRESWITVTIYTRHVSTHKNRLEIVVKKGIIQSPVVRKLAKRFTIENWLSIIDSGSKDGGGKGS